MNNEQIYEDLDLVTTTSKSISSSSSIPFTRVHYLPTNSISDTITSALYGQDETSPSLLNNSVKLDDYSLSCGFFLASSAANVPDVVRVAKKKKRRKFQNLEDIGKRRCYPIEDEISINSLSIWPGAAIPSVQDIAAKTRFTDVALLERVLSRSVVSGWLGTAFNADISESDTSKLDPTLSQGVWAHRFVALTPSCLWIFMPRMEGIDYTTSSTVGVSSTSSNRDVKSEIHQTSLIPSIDRVEPIAGPPALKPERRLVINTDSSTYGISGSDFQVFSDSLLITLRAASEAEASAWLVHIHSCIAATRKSSASENVDPSPIALSDNHLLCMAEAAIDESAQKASTKIEVTSNSLLETKKETTAPVPILDTNIFSESLDTTRSSFSINMRRLLSNFPVRMRLRAFARRVLPENVPLIRAWEMMSLFDIVHSCAESLGSKIVLKSAVDVFDRFFGRGATDPISLPNDIMHTLSLELYRCGTLSQDIVTCPPSTLFVNSTRAVEDMIRIKVLGPYARALSCLLVAARQSPNEAASDVLISTKGGLLRQLSRSSFSNIATPGTGETALRRNSMSPGENPQPVSRRSSLFSVIPDAFAAATTSSRSRSTTRTGSFMSPSSSTSKMRSKSVSSAATESVASPATMSASIALNLSEVLDVGAADISGFDFDFESNPSSSIRSALPPSSVDISLLPRTSILLQGRGSPLLLQGSTVSDDFIVESIVSSFLIPIALWSRTWLRSLGVSKPSENNNKSTDLKTCALIPHEKVVLWISRRHGVNAQQLTDAYSDTVSELKSTSETVDGEIAAPLPAALRAVQDAITEAVLMSQELRSLRNINEDIDIRNKESSDLSDYLYSALFGELKTKNDPSLMSYIQKERKKVNLDSRSLVARNSHPLAATLRGPLRILPPTGLASTQTSSSIRTILSGVLMNPTFEEFDTMDGLNVTQSIVGITRTVLVELVRPNILQLSMIRPGVSRKDRIAALGGKVPLNSQLLAQKEISSQFISVDGAVTSSIVGYPVPVLFSQEVLASFSSRGFSPSSFSPRGLNDGSCVIDVSIIPSSGSAIYSPKKLTCDLNVASYSFASTLSSPRTPGNIKYQGRKTIAVIHADGSLALYEQNFVPDSSNSAWSLFSSSNENESQDEVKPKMLGLVFLQKSLDITFTNNVYLPRHCIDVIMPAGILNLIPIDGDSSGLFDALMSASKTKSLTSHALVVQGTKAGGKKVRLQIRSELISLRTEQSGIDSKISSFVPLPFFLSSSTTSVVILKGAMYKRGKIRTAFTRRDMRVTATFTTSSSLSASGNTSVSTMIPSTSSPATSELDNLFQQLRSGPFRVPPFSRSSDQRPLPLVIVRAVALAALDRAITAKENPLPSLENLMNTVKISEVKLEYSKGAALRGSIVLWNSGSTYAIGVVPVSSITEKIEVDDPKKGSISSFKSTSTETTSIKSGTESRKKWIGDTSGSFLKDSTFFALYTEGRVWQFACDDANEAREWVAILSALCVPRDSAIARTLPKTRPGFSSADESLMKAILIVNSSSSKTTSKS